MKALFGFIEVAGLYFALTQLTHRNISQNHKFQAVGLGEYDLFLPEITCLGQILITGLVNLFSMTSQLEIQQLRISCFKMLADIIWRIPVLIGSLDKVKEYL